MLLAATKATFKSEFGPSFISHDIQLSNRTEMELEKLEKRLAGAQIQQVQPVTSSDLPYTHIEKELSSVRKDKINLPQPKQGSQVGSRPRFMCVFRPCCVAFSSQSTRTPSSC